MGIPASGKSTYFRRHLVNTHVRINRDMLRTSNRVRVVLAACCGAGISFCSDNTNVTREERRLYIDVAQRAGFTISGIFFESRIDDCLRRNAGRPAAERVPEAGVRGRRNELELPKFDEGFDSLQFARIANDQFELSEWEE